MKTMKKLILTGMFLAGMQMMACTPPSLFYHIENNSMYWSGKELKEVDLKTLTIITSDGKNIPLKDYKEQIASHFIKDKNNVYYQGEKIQGADPSTFKALGEDYFKDKNNVYQLIMPKEKKIPNIAGLCDLSKFEGSVKKMEKADPNTFEALGNGYFKDKNSVYYYKEKVKRADPNTFKTNNSYGEAEDKNHKYYLGKVKK